MADHDDPMCPATLAGIEHRQDICRCEEYARVRADERERHWRLESFIDVDGYPSMRTVKGEYVSENKESAIIRAAVAEEIAQAIEEKADDLGWDPTVDALSEEDSICAVRDMVKDEIHDCAAIARRIGGAQ